MNIHVIGAGGTGSYLLPVLARTVRHMPEFRDSVITVWDGDIVEERNLERQGFSKADVSFSKAEVLVDNYGWITAMVAKPEFFTGRTELSPDEAEGLFISCADNHTARLACLDRADMSINSYTIIAGNTFEVADAYFYTSAFHGTHKDPRKRYPELLDPDPFDPTALRCNSEEALEAAPQLAHINMMAASLIMKLFWIWFVKIGSLDASLWPKLPIEFRSTTYNMEKVEI